MDAAFQALIGDDPAKGAIIVILIIGFVAASRLVLTEKDKRIDDAIKVRDDVAEPLRQINESIARMEGKIVISKKAEDNEGA